MALSITRKPRFRYRACDGILLAADLRDVDPRELRVPPSRSSGADPYKLQLQIARFVTMTSDRSDELLNAIATVKRMCPDMRFGQMLATLSMLGEDMTDRNFWDIEDSELLTVVERFRQDLARREHQALTGIWSRKSRGRTPDGTE